MGSVVAKVLVAIGVNDDERGNDVERQPAHGRQRITREDHGQVHFTFKRGAGSPSAAEAWFPSRYGADDTIGGSGNLIPV